MPKAKQVLVALNRDGWVEVRRKGSHRFLIRGDAYQTWAYHDGDDLGKTDLRLIGKRFGYSVEALYRMLRG